ncbi:tripartite tricarboxylate transporter substrate binding protein [Pigmentiphaga sp.]|uniref:Bug family tripartite tricarboxylate transporter substrate binding protein n=1 Tax=Pigmentiphaga sp. TaxID=1977564 RepID=UPI0025D59F9A|nr:tripartite tricarboxylate transporter substrate binding protein [Pigmentiphaga sp.]
MKRRTFMAGLAALPAATGRSWAASGASFPSRPIRILVGYQAGGTLDRQVRFVAEALQASMGVPVIVENRPGASGNIGASALVQAPADGYTLMLAENATLFLNQHLFKNLNYQPYRDFQFIGAMGMSSFALVVNPAFPTRTLEEFIAHCRAHPGQLNYASAGVTSAQRIAMELFLHAYGLDMVHVAYNGGRPARLDLMRGAVQAMMAELSGGLDNIRSGQIRPLAVAARERVPSIPDVPTFAEKGAKDVVYVSLTGFVGPAGMPAEIVHQLNAELNKALSDRKVEGKLREDGVERLQGSPEAFLQRVRAEDQRNLAILRAYNIHSE